MSTIPKTWSPSAIATELGMDRRKLGLILGRVEPIKQSGNRKEYLLVDVIEKLKKETGQVVDLEEARRRKLQAEAELTEIESAKAKGEAIALDDVEHLMTNIITTAKSKLLSIPTKLSPLLSAETDQKVIKTYLEDNINEALEELAKYDIQLNEDSETEITESNLQEPQQIQTTTAINDK